MADHGNMLAGASDASSSSHDRYTITPEEESPPPPGPNPPLSAAAVTLRDGFMIATGPSAINSVIQLRVQSVRMVKIAPKTLSQAGTDDARFERPLWCDEESLRLMGMPVPDNFAYTSKELNLLFASALLVKIRRNEIRAVIVHVLDFDFALVKEKVFSKFSAANREHYNSHILDVWFTVSPGYARTWTPTKLKEWIDWRDAEDAAEREMSIRYRVSGSFTLNAAELDGLRNSLHYHDLYGDKGGGMGKIMACFKDYFRGEYQRLGI